jgi:hypothetical protein
LHLIFYAISMSKATRAQNQCWMVLKMRYSFLLVINSSIYIHLLVNFQNIQRINLVYNHGSQKHEEIKKLVKELLVLCFLFKV